MSQKMQAKRLSTVGVPFSPLSKFTKRYAAAVQVEQFAADYILSDAIVIQDFNEQEMIADFVSRSTSGTIGGVPRKMIRLLFSNFSNSDALITGMRHDEDLVHLKPFVVPLVQASFYTKLLASSLSDPAIIDMLKVDLAKVTLTFSAKRVYQNPLFMVDMYRPSFTPKSIVHGLKGSSPDTSKKSSFGQAMNNLIRSFTEASAISLYIKAVKERNDGSKNPVTIEIMDEFKVIAAKVQDVVTFSDFSESELIERIFNSPRTSERSPKMVVSSIRHRYSNYDELYASDMVRNHKYATLIGYQTVRYIVHKEIAKNAESDMVRGVAQMTAMRAKQTIEKTAVMAGKKADVDAYMNDIDASTRNKLENDKKKRDDRSILCFIPA